MKPFISRVLLFAFLLSVTPVFSQTDTEFWFAAPDVAFNDVNNRHDAPVYLRLSTLANSATVTISQPANPSFTPIVVQIPANSTESVDLSNYLNDIECTYNKVENKGILITSTAPNSPY